MLHEQLREWGIDISVGQIDVLLSGANDAFLPEQEQRLLSAREVRGHVTVDDSGARHQGNNGSVTQIGNEWFAGFASTGSKSRINLLQLLHAGPIPCTLNEHAFSYFQEERLPKEPRAAYRRNPKRQSPRPPVGRGTSMRWESRVSAIGASPPRGRCSVG